MIQPLVLRTSRPEAGSFSLGHQDQRLDHSGWGGGAGLLIEHLHKFMTCGLFKFLTSFYCDITIAQLFDGPFYCDVKKSAIKCDVWLLGIGQLISIETAKITKLSTHWELCDCDLLSFNRNYDQAPMPYIICIS